MERRTLQIVVIIAAVGLAALASVSVIAIGGDSKAEESRVMSLVHRLGEHLHGGGHHKDHMGQLIDQLDLTPDQLQHLDKIHEIIGSYGGKSHGSMAELHDDLVAQFERGYVETDEIRQVIDGHVEQMRVTAYAVTDELVALINGLDEKQREIVLAHLQGAPEGHHGHGH